MRITSELLHKIARDTVSQRCKTERDLLAAYLHGSILEEEPLLGGTTDIDLFFVHNEDVEQEREIVRMTDEVTLDIAHHPRSLYRQTRELRLHPWLGNTIYGCKIIYDPQHFMDFTQASVRGQFLYPENIMARSRQQAEHARQIWFSFESAKNETGIETVQSYLKAVNHAVNAIACLSGAPLPGRRFLLRFPKRAEAVGRPGLYAGALGLLGGSRVDAGALKNWLPLWQAACEALPVEVAPLNLHRSRLPYYLRAFDAMLGSDAFQAVLWPLVDTWTEASSLLPSGSPGRNGWEEACQRLGLLGEAFSEHLAGLDAYLDVVEETLDTWAAKNGVSNAE